jgi:hypothetical protein
MWRSVAIAWALAATVLAEGFSFTIGNPVAAQDFRAKGAAFVFRTEGCSQSPSVTATAEGLTNQRRSSVALRIAPLAAPGVFAVYRNWPVEGQWVVNLVGTCGTAAAGAIVAVGPQGLLREQSTFFPHRPSAAEIDKALATLASRGVQ